MQLNEHFTEIVVVHPEVDMNVEFHDNPSDKCQPARRKVRGSPKSLWRLWISVPDFMKIHWMD